MHTQYSCTCTLACTHNTRAHLHLHAHTCLYTHTLMRTQYLCTCTLACTHTHAHTCLCTHTRMHTLACTHSHIHTLASIHTLACNTYSHALVNTYQSSFVKEISSSHSSLCSEPVQGLSPHISRLPTQQWLEINRNGGDLRRVSSPQNDHSATFQDAS